MEFKHPKYYAELRRQARLQAGKVTSSQAEGGKHPNQCSRVQASSQNSQAQRSRDQGTSAQARVSGRKQQG
tara:strand:- start:456 stop:668 length:213 start_codon:yes stop_codon:yes gene_type:complete